MEAASDSGREFPEPDEPFEGEPWRRNGSSRKGFLSGFCFFVCFLVVMRVFLVGISFLWCDLTVVV